MVLVDTSVWVTHFREGHRDLEKLLLDGDVASHPFIVGELACGNLKARNEIISLLRSLHMAPVLDSYEFLLFIERHKLMGLGIGFVDVHLLASARMADLSLWTSDRRLRSAAAKLQIAYP